MVNFTCLWGKIFMLKNYLTFNDRTNLDFDSTTVIWLISIRVNRVTPADRVPLVSAVVGCCRGSQHRLVTVWRPPRGSSTGLSSALRMSIQKLMWTAYESSYPVYQSTCYHVMPKLHYTGTGYGHRLRTPQTDTTDGRAHNNSTTNLPHRNARALQHLDMSRCWDVANFCALVVNLLYNKF